ncbi:MAG: aldolase/citrate lyase family protein [Pirellulales bacterium]
MFEAIAEFRQKLNAGEICLGAGITLADSSVVEAIAPLVDFFWIDLEHTHLSYETVQAHLIAARAGGVAALVRVRGSDIPHLKPVLDIGASGVIVPQVRSADEVRQVVSACRYPPLGTRGYGPRRAADYGRRGGAAWMQQVNDQVFLGVQIENLDALAEVDEIARIERLDSIVLGPYDLSIALGYAGQLDHPEVLSAIRRIIAAARAGRKYVGTGMAANPDDARAAIALGVQWIQCGDDYTYMIARANELMQEIRGAGGISQQQP